MRCMSYHFCSNTTRYPTRAEVDRANQVKLISLPGDGIKYDATDTPGRDSNDRPIPLEHMGRLLERLVAQQAIHLKVLSLILLTSRLHIAGWRASHADKGNVGCLQMPTPELNTELEHGTRRVGEWVCGSSDQV
jgi:hypothetical protein